MAYVRYRCPVCKDDNCGHDATSRWNELTQEDELSCTYDDEWCNDCGEIKLDRIEITDPAEIALIDRELARKRAMQFAPELYEHVKTLLPMAELHVSTNDPESAGSAVTAQARALVEAIDNAIDPVRSSINARLLQAAIRIKTVLDSCSILRNPDDALQELEAAIAAASSAKSVFTVWVQHSNGFGTTWIGAVKADTPAAARTAAIHQCAAAWGRANPENLQVIGIAEGNVAILDWHL